jgi:transposase InsO family protein
VVVEFLILGPLELRHDGHPIEVGGTRRRALAEAVVVIEDRRQDYNAHRPHSALANKTPAVFARAWARSAVPASGIGIFF